MATTHFSGPVDSKAGFKVNGVEIINGSREVQLGTSTSPISHTVQTSHTLEINTTSSSTSGSTSYEPILFSTKLTGVGQVGGRVKAYLETNVALGGWSNALKGEVKYGDAGKTTGLGSAVVAEMTLGKGTNAGTYSPLEVELNMPTGALTGTATALAHLSVQGAAVATFDTNGYVLNIQGLTAGVGKVITAGTTLGTAYGSMRILVGTTPYYIPLYAAPAS